MGAGRMGRARGRGAACACTCCLQGGWFLLCPRNPVWPTRGSCIRPGEGRHAHGRAAAHTEADASPIYWPTPHPISTEPRAELVQPGPPEP